MNIYKKLVVALEKQHNFGLKANELNAIVNKVTANKVKLKNSDEWAALVQSMLQEVRNNPLKVAVAEAKRVVAAKEQRNDICPFCNNICEKISLMGDRPANYCKTHLVVLPQEFTSSQL